MVYYITHIKDSTGNNYLGINIPQGIVEPFLKELKELIGDDDYEKYTYLQKQRDHGYHITVINTTDYNRLSKEMGIDKFVNSLDKVFKYELDDVKMIGIGTAARNENRAYFIVCDSDKLAAVRDRYGLSKHDFHITLGFFHKDVFGVPKNEIIEKSGKFVKLLQIEYNKNNNFNFIKNIENFDLDIKAEIIPISISNSTMKIKCQDYYLNISWLEDGEKFWITNKFPIVENLPRLPETEITKILNKK
jgi:hypothetical protein